MKPEKPPSLINREVSDIVPGIGGAWIYILCIGLTVVLFITDLILPRGATEAIGYCLVLFIAAGTRRRGFLVSAAITCTVLIWIAFFFEPARRDVWRPVFDRSMITGVIWFAFLLVERRAMVIRTLVDQTRELKAATAELERSNGELASFASVVAHDLRGPLNTIGLLAQLLTPSEPTEAGSDQQESADSIQKEVTRMDGLIENLLHYGRVGSGELKLQTCDCAQVLEEVQRNLKASIETNHVQFTISPLPVIRADPVLMLQLFQNLIENSIKYRSEAPPHIDISARRVDGAWQFAVTDNGIGIPPEDSERIFKPFCQTNHDKSHGNGVGLGLATCKRIVERHGGHIQVQSKPAAGTTFTFTIPADSIAADSPGPAPLMQQAGSNGSGLPGIS